MTRSRLPEDLIQKIIRLEKRLSDLESVNRLTNASVGSGEFTLSGGDLVIRDDAGNKVLEIIHGTEPYIAIYPSDENAADDKIVIKGASNLNEGVELQASIQTSSSVQDGARLRLKKDYATLRHTPSGSPETTISLGKISGFSQSILFRGKWLPSTIVDKYQAVITDTLNIEAGFSSLIVSYDRTMDSQMIPLVSLLNALGAVSWSVTAQSSSGFTVAWSGTDAKTISYWSFRI